MNPLAGVQHVHDVFASATRLPDPGGVSRQAVDAGGDRELVGPQKRMRNLRKPIDRRVLEPAAF